MTLAPFRRQWGWPIVLAAASLFGLVTALLGEGGVWWWLSWLALALPLATILRALRPKARPASAAASIRRP